MFKFFRRVPSSYRAKKIFNDDALINDESISAIIETLFSSKYVVDSISYISTFKKLNTVNGGPYKKERLYKENWCAVEHTKTNGTKSTKRHKIIVYHFPKYKLIKLNTGSSFITFLPKHEVEILKLIRSFEKQKEPEKLINLINKDFDKLIINEDILEDVREFVFNYLLTKNMRDHLGQEKRCSIIFSGKPGDGKTFLANELCRILRNYTGFNIIRDEATVFEKASKLEQNFIAFLDDLNKSHFNRKGPYADICSNMLSEMDRPGCNRIFLMTTNEQINDRDIDPPFFRPGRIEKIIQFGPPSENSRRKFFEKSFMSERVEKIIKEPRKELDGLVTILTAETDGLSFAQINGLRDYLYQDYIINQKLDVKKALTNLHEVDRYLAKQEKYAEHDRLYSLDDDDD